MVVGERTSAAAMMAGANGERTRDWVCEGLKRGKERMDGVDVDERVKLIEVLAWRQATLRKRWRLDA